MKKWEALFRRIVLHNLGLKVLSLAVAIVLFSLVRGSQDTQVSLFVDVHAVLPAEATGKMLISDLPARVRVSVKGTSSAVGRLEHAPIQIDVTDTSRRFYYFDREDFQFPAGVTVTDWDPRSVPLTWAVAAERQAPVTLRLQGEPLEGLELHGDARVTPSEVSFRGPVRSVSMIENVDTERIPLSEFEAGRHEEHVRLEPLPEHAHYIDSQIVTVSFELVPQVAERALHSRLVTQVGGVSIAQIRPRHVTVVVQGEPSVLEAIDPEQIVPFVSVEALQGGGGAQPVPVQVQGIPTGAELTRTEPESVLVTLPAQE